MKKEQRSSSDGSIFLGKHHGENGFAVVSGAAHGLEGCGFLLLGRHQKDDFEKQQILARRFASADVHVEHPQQIVGAASLGLPEFARAGWWHDRRLCAWRSRSNPTWLPWFVVLGCALTMRFLIVWFVFRVI